MYSLGDDQAGRGLAPSKAQAQNGASPAGQAAADGSRPPTPGILKKATGTNSLSGSRKFYSKIDVRYSLAEHALHATK